MPVCSCVTHCECIVTNLTGETLDAAPEYLRKDAIRWSSAAQLYEELQNSSSRQRVSKMETKTEKKKKQKCKSQYHSPERSPMRRRLSHSHFQFGGSLLEINNHGLVVFWHTAKNFFLLLSQQSC
uniref:Uncharacterized protein n=1 Tax=Caenorhabditis japonica TaxID=281687 RepID=A0A8R1HYU7_CAEJA